METARLFILCNVSLPHSQQAAAVLCGTFIQGERQTGKYTLESRFVKIRGLICSAAQTDFNTLQFGIFF